MEPNERKPKKTVQPRDSRAAQAAQRRRVQRREDRRLEELRQKQKRKARRRTGRRIRPSTLRSLLIMCGVLLAVVLSMLIFFRVGDEQEHILVSGNQYYTKEEILAACGVSKGDNLLILSRGKVAGNLIAALPYIRSVQVTRQLPDTLLLQITEYGVSYAVRDEAGLYYLMTAGGKITSQVTENAAREYMQIGELRIRTPSVGAAAVVADEDTSSAELRMNALKALLSELETAGLNKQVSAVRVSSAFSLELDYGTQYVVKLGGSDRMAYKLQYLKQIVERLESYQSGTIDLSFSQGEEARFTPKS